MTRLRDPFARITLVVIFLFGSTPSSTAFETCFFSSSKSVTLSKWKQRHQPLLFPKSCSNNQVFRLGMGYVPDGLTAEEYEKIKAKEKAEKEKKTFGAWGPRFRRTAAPTGAFFQVFV